MRVTLLNNTPLEIADHAIGKCWDKPTPEGEPCNIKRIHRVGNKNKHASTLEHLSYNFDIDGVSRALLQELARHRIASYSVKSTRYTLKELKEEAPFMQYGFEVSLEQIKRSKTYLVHTQNDAVDIRSIWSLEMLRVSLKQGVSSDIAKYSMPEAYKTSIVWTINARSLQNFLTLRTNKAALWEIRELAYEVFKQLPDDHKFLFEEFLYVEHDTDGDS